MYLPLYNENIGLGGFKCKECGRVTRTERGIKSHLWRVHGQKIQLELFTAEPVRPDRGGTGSYNKGGASIVVYVGDPRIRKTKTETDCLGNEMPEVRREGSEER